MSVQKFAIPVVSVLILFGAAVYSLIAVSEDQVLNGFEGKRVVLEGTVVRDPDVREKTVRLTIQPEKINSTAITNTSNVLVLTERFVDVSYGDSVQVAGILRTPEAFETDTGRTFNYPRYLWAHGISHTISFAHIEVVNSGNGNPVVSTLLSIKNALIVGIERALPEPYAALSEGLLLGEKQSLGDRLTKAFRNAGVVHIIVLSGYNVALVINSVLYISLRFLPRLVGYSIAAVFVLAFAILTGASETTVRATIMALLMMVARVLNRPAAALRGLLIAAAAMALWNPFLVLYDLSFQLSVVATFGLILFSDRIARHLRFVPEHLGLREITATTLATQITVLPLLILSIGAVSLVFLPANVLVLPAVPLAMFFSFIASLSALLSPFIALPFSFVAYLLLAYIISVSEFFGTLPFALLPIPENLTWAVLIFLGTLYALIFFISLRPSTVLLRRKPF